MINLKAWIKASRLTAQAYIFFPLLLGNAIAYSLTKDLSVPFFLLSHLFGIFIQLYILYGNDYADEEADKDNDTYTIFTGGSRTLVNGIISKSSMKRAILLMVLLNISLGIILTLFFNRPLSMVFVGLALFLLWAYSYDPIKLSYRGGGEILQGIGLAILLPLFAFYLQKGSIYLFPMEILFILIPIHLSCALSTTLPDYPSDKIHQKNTFSVIFSPFVIKLGVISFNLLSIILLISYGNISFNTSIAISAVPLMFTLILPFFFNHSDAGSKRLFYFVLFNIASIIFFVCGLGIYFFIA